MVFSVPPSPDHYPPDPVQAGPAQQDRRRRGRLSADARLIPLLRGTDGSRDPADLEHPPVGEPVTDKGNFARCLFFTVLLAVPLWGIIGAICYWMNH